jgi:glycosyltransferase involved in cell wall biosynthesis
MSVVHIDARRETRSPRVSVVVPALNEAKNLAVVLPYLPPVHEVILVDGGSVDGTIAAARHARPDVITILQSGAGKGNALAAGFARVTGDVVVMFDADGSADPTEIERFVQTLKDGADVAKGSRFTSGGWSADITRIRSLGNRCLNALFNLVFRTRHTDLCYGYNAFWADLIPVLDLPDAARPSDRGTAMRWGDGFEIETVMSCRFVAAGADIVEVPSVELARLYGDTHLHAVKDGLRVLGALFVERCRSLGRSQESRPPRYSGSSS